MNGQLAPNRLRWRRGADVIRHLLELVVAPDSLDFLVDVARRRRHHLAIAALLSRSQVR